MPRIPSLRSWLRRSWQRRDPARGAWAQLQVEPLEVRAVPAKLAVGPNVNTGHQAGNQSETQIAIDPVNPLHMFAAANDNAVAQGMYGAVSTDGGVTWKSRVVAGGNDGLPVGVTDPGLSWDSFGNLFFTYINDALTDCIVALSTDGGLTFKSAGQFPVADQPHVATGAGEVAVSYNDPNNNQSVSSAKVTGLGAVGAFSTVTVPNSANGNFGSIAIGPTGQITVNFQHGNTGAGPDTIMVSNDPTGVGGAFGTPITASPTNVGGFRDIPPQMVRSVDAEAKLAYDRSTGAHKGRLYLVYTDAPSVTSNDTNIFLRHSDNSGATWSAPLRVNDDTTTNSQFFSYDAVDQTTGDLALSWYDCRNSPSNTKVEVFATVSQDGGASVQKNVQVAAGQSDATVNLNNDNQYGDYMGLDFNHGAFFPCWVDNSSTLPGNTDLPNFDIATAKVSVQPVPPPPAAPPIAKVFFPFRWVYDPRTGLYSGDLTLENIGFGPLIGSVTIVFPSLPRGVTLANATTHVGGAPAITLPFVALGHNQAVRVTLEFTDPFHMPLGTFYTPFPVQLIIK
jgi:hypothetical protein